MSKLASCKFLITASVALWVAFGIEIGAKQLAARAAMSHANKKAVTSAPEEGAALASKSDSATILGMVVAGIGGFCWAASAYRGEPGSSLLAFIPAILYGGFLLLLV